MSEPDLTTEIVGFRQWRVTPELELRAAAHIQGSRWALGVNEAVCHRVPLHTFVSSGDINQSLPKADPCGDTPGQDCECGFYALYDPSALWYGKPQPVSFGLNLYSWPVSESSDPLVSGVIVGWGKVQVHHQGFRSQYARIVALALPEGKRDAAVTRAVAAAYGVPCVPVDELPKIAAEFGTTVQQDMRPGQPEPPPFEIAAQPGQLYAQLAGRASVQWSGSGTYPYPAYYSQPVLPPPPAPKPRPRSRWERKQSNRQGPHDKKRAPKNQRGKDWGAW